MLRTLLKSRSTLRSASLARMASTVSPSAPSTATSTPISTPTLRKLETRWEALPEDDKSEIITALAERQKVDWHDLTPLEKKAAWYISYGEWGPRRPIHAKGDAQRIVVGTLIGVAAAAAIFFGIRACMPEQPKTMSAEWQQASTEELESINAEPFTGPNMVQSPPRGISPSDGDDDDDDE